MIKLDLKLSQKGLILVSVPLLFELVFVTALVFMLQEAEHQIFRETQARTFLSHIGRINMSALDAESAAAGYSVSRAAFFLQIFNDAVHSLPDEFKALKRLASDNRQQLKAVVDLDDLMNEIVTRLGAALKSLEAGEEMEGLAALEEGKNLQEDFRIKVAEMLANEEKVLRASSRARIDARQGVQNVLTAGVVFNIILAFGLAFYFNKGTTSRLAVLMDNTFRLAQEKGLNPVLAGSDEIAHLDKVFHDMADALAEAARKERAMVDNAIDVICSLDASGKFVRVSPASTKVWGYTPEELIGTKYSDLVIAQDAGKGLNEARKSLHGAPFESRVRRKDGAIVHMLWSAYWSPSENSLFCVAHDITERKRAEEQLRASEARVRQIIDSMPVGLVMINESGVIEMTNPSALELFQYAQADLSGRHIMTLFGEQKVPAAEYMDALFAESMGRITERTARRKDGSTFPVEITLKGYLARDGQRYLAIMLDVTERHEIDRLKQEFFAMVSHDLRSPLTSIQAFLMMLGEGIYGELTPKGAEKAGAADRSATRLLKLVNDLLDLDKLESGRFDLEMNDVPVATIIERSVDALRAIAEQKGIVIETPETDLKVHADADRVIQVLVNLLGNAIKYSPPGEPVVISVHPLDGHVQVRVTDRGRGIPEHMRGAVFERFKQVDVKDRKEKGGSGLGLAIAKALIEQQAGSIGVDSEEGKGSSFWFQIPAASPNGQS